MENWEKKLARLGNHLLASSTLDSDSWAFYGNISLGEEKSMQSRSVSILCLLTGAQLSQSIFLSHLGFVQRRFGNQVCCWERVAGIY